jgi:ribosome maturation factor RimP
MADGLRIVDVVLVFSIALWIHRNNKTGNSPVYSQEAGLTARFFMMVSKKVQAITRDIADLAEPVLEDMGYELVDVAYLSKYGRWILRLTIDKEGGVTIDDCARVSRELGDLIDVKDILTGHYVLEVSSPGLDRPLKKEKDFAGALGKKIKVKTLEPMKGRRKFLGILTRFEEGILYLDMEDGTVALPWSDVDKANLVYEFGR